MAVVAVVAVVAIVALLVVASLKPNTFSVERSIRVNAPAERVFVEVNDFHRWATWSPWENLDANLQRTYSGADAGVGAVYEWQGNSKAGQGRMEIKQTTVPSSIQIQLDFLKPFEAHNTVEFSLQAQGDVTEVTWKMYGPANFMSKLMGTVMSMDKLVGKDFEKGLNALKQVAEAASQG